MYLRALPATVTVDGATITIAQPGRTLTIEAINDDTFLIGPRLRAAAVFRHKSLIRRACRLTARSFSNARMRGCVPRPGLRRKSTKERMLWDFQDLLRQLAASNMVPLPERVPTQSV